ncbi:hypothetical protein KAU11_06880 [Candidatus Babeliales bacterium]|nr:hypothetical protein [Candidatus Babeliales bacterium]
MAKARKIGNIRKKHAKGKGPKSYMTSTTPKKVGKYRMSKKGRSVGRKK